MSDWRDEELEYIAELANEGAWKLLRNAWDAVSEALSVLYPGMPDTPIGLHNTAFTAMGGEALIRAQVQIARSFAYSGQKGEALPEWACQALAQMVYDYPKLMKI